MTNRNYSRGRQWEYTLAALLKKKGWKVLRSAGSHSGADLLAGRAAVKGQPARCMAIQCKSGDAHLEGKELADLVTIAGAFEAEVIIATRKKRKRTYEYLNPITGSPEEVTEEWFS